MASRVWTKDETKKLISKLEELPELWDSSLENYKNRVKRTAANENLAAELGMDPREVSRKLHNLRTQLNNELRKLRKRTSGQGADETLFKSAWEFFDALQFMIPSAKRNETQSNYLPPLQDTTENPEDPQQSKGQKRKNVHKEDEILEKALEVMNKPTNNPDDAQIFGNFVASALRNMKTEDNKRKLKRKIQAAILEMEELDEASSSAPSSATSTPIPSQPWFPSEESSQMHYTYL